MRLSRQLLVAGCVFSLLALYRHAFVGSFSLILITPEAAGRFGAACLDGSPPGYYFRKGADSTKWRVHLRGGAWCTDEASCLERSKTDLGSSKFWATNVHEAVYGFMSDEKALEFNFMAEWNTVFIMYCDGSSYTSNRDQPLAVGSATLHLRGRANLLAIFQDLEDRAQFLTRSTEVVLSGTSAGGLAVLLNANLVRLLLPPTTKLRGLPGAGFFLDHANLSGQYSFRQYFKNGLTFWNVSHIDNAKCFAALDPAEHWKCLMAPYLFPYLDNVPMFLIDSMYDAWQLGTILQLPCSLTYPVLAKWGPKCNSSQIQIAQQYRDAYTVAIDAAIPSSSIHGYYLIACHQHGATCRNFDWFDLRVHQLSPAQVFSSWYHQDTRVKTKQIDGRWPENQSCSPLYHGPC